VQSKEVGAVDSESFRELTLTVLGRVGQSPYQAGIYYRLAYSFA